jgi:hypothetical protein
MKVQQISVKMKPFQQMAGVHVQLPNQYIFFSSRALRHCSYAGLLYPYPNEFRHSTPEALHTKRRERPLLAKDGTKTKVSILLATRNLLKLLGSFTSRKTGTWETYFTSPPKEGMLRIFTAPEKSNSFGRD